MTNHYVRGARPDVMSRSHGAGGLVQDAGLTAHLNGVYAQMMIAMILSGLTAYVVGMELEAVIGGGATALIPEALLVQMFAPPWVYLIIFAPLALAIGFGFLARMMSVPVARGLFYVFSVAMGLSLSTVFVRYTDASIVQSFVAASAAFGATSLYGYTTKSDLSGWGRFLIMGVVGIIVVSLLNMFVFESAALETVLSVVVLLVFAALTAYDAQRLRNEYLEMRRSGYHSTVMEKSAIFGALSLYLNFVNMFMAILSLSGEQD